MTYELILLNISSFMQRILRMHGYFCSVRITRGDDEAAACGMLTTKNRKMTSSSAESSSINVDSV